MSDSLRPHELQYARPPCPSPTPGAYPNSCPLSRWCHPTISSSVIPFTSCPQSFPTSRSFQMSQLFASGGQSIGVSIQDNILKKFNMELVFKISMQFVIWFLSRFHMQTIKHSHNSGTVEGLSIRFHHSAWHWQWLLVKLLVSIKESYNWLKNTGKCFILKASHIFFFFL